MKTHCLESPQFKLDLQVKIFEADIKYPSNTIMTVNVESDGFCAVADMDIDIKALADFAEKLSLIYASLKGNAIIREPYGEKQFIEFCGDGKGRINVCGKLTSSGRGGFSQELHFENSIEQTYLPEFISNISKLCENYL